MKMQLISHIILFTESLSLRQNLINFNITKLSRFYNCNQMFILFP